MNTIHDETFTSWSLREKERNHEKIRRISKKNSTLLVKNGYVGNAGNSTENVSTIEQF